MIQKSQFTSTELIASLFFVLSMIPSALYLSGIHKCFFITSIATVFFFAIGLILLGISAKILVNRIIESKDKNDD